MDDFPPLPGFGLLDNAAAVLGVFESVNPNDAEISGARDPVAATYAAVVTRHPDLAGVEQLHGGLAMRCNNRVEQAHQPTRERVPRDRA
jgi:hypothetical protein